MNRKREAKFLFAFVSSVEPRSQAGFHEKRPPFPSSLSELIQIVLDCWWGYVHLAGVMQTYKKISLALEMLGLAD